MVDLEYLRITHISDWHGRHIGRNIKLPWSEMYVVTGDMLLNYPRYSYMYCIQNNLKYIDERREAYYQSKEVRETNLSQCIPNKEAIVVYVRGNHDYVGLSSLFPNHKVYVINNPAQIVDVCGLRVAGFRGVPSINGDWSDEFTDSELLEKVDCLSEEIDILVTHAPPNGILDKVTNGPRVGIKALSSYLNKQSYTDGPLRLHCFGHIHEEFRSKVPTDGTGGITYSNAAGGYHQYVWKNGDVAILRSNGNIFVGSV